MKKRSMIQKLISLMILFVLAVSCSALADGESRGFTYVLLSDGTASITGCSLSGDVVIPSVIDGYTVTNLARELFYGVSGITSVSIPATVTYFGSSASDNMWDYVFSYCYNLKSINVASGNPSFSSVDGILFNKSKTILINYPCSKDGTVFHVPASVGDLCCTSFASSRNLQKLYLDGQNTWWYTYTFYNDDGLTVYYLPGGSSENKAKKDIENGMTRDADAPFPIFKALSSAQGWQKEDGKWYYYKNGEMKTGWQKISNKWYYFNSSGVMQSGWIQLGGKWYYLGNEMKTGWQKISNKWYYFNSSGVMQSGWIQLGGKWYYLGSEMKTRWQKINNKWYYFDDNGVMQSGWQKIGGKWYYLDNGAMVTGTKVIGGKTYTFDSNGVWQE